MSWVIITGGGGGIGRGLVHHFCRAGHKVLTCGRRGDALAETKRLADRPSDVVTVPCDIGTSEGRSALVAAFPNEEGLKLLVHNAAIGDPAALGQIDIKHFEESLHVNVVAPLALTQEFLSALVSGSGRVLHLGTSVAHNPQRGTATYGVTKAAFHRLYQQLNAEGVGVPVGSLSPGMVDTEGVRDHVDKARSLELPHVKYFDQAFEKGWTTDMQELCKFIDELLAMGSDEFTSKEWRFSEWRKKCELADSSL